MCNAGPPGAVIASQWTRWRGNLCAGSIVSVTKSLDGCGMIKAENIGKKVFYVTV